MTTAVYNDDTPVEYTNRDTTAGVCVSCVPQYGYLWNAIPCHKELSFACYASKHNILGKSRNIVIHKKVVIACKQEIRLSLSITDYENVYGRSSVP